MNKRILIGGVIFFALITIVVVVVFVLTKSSRSNSPTGTTVPVATDYQMYGNYMLTGPVDNIAYVPEINQYVAMARQGHLKMVSFDNKQNRYTSDPVFDPAKWNNGYSVGDIGGYMVRRKSLPSPTNPGQTTPVSSNYEMSGTGIDGFKPVENIAYVPEINKYVAMVRYGDQLKMVSLDNTQSRLTSISAVFDPSKWNNGYVDGNQNTFNVRRKTS